MKILVIGHAYSAAVNRSKWQVTAQLYPELQLKVIVPTHWPDVLFSLNAENAAHDNVTNCEFIPLPASHVGSEYLYRYRFSDLRNIIASFNPDIIHVEQGAIATCYLQAYALAKLVGCKAKFIFFTWRNWEEKRSLRYKIRWRPYEQAAFWLSSGAITGNQDARSILQKKGFQKSIKVLPQLGADMVRYHPAQRKEVSTKTVLFLGRIVAEKGVVLLAQAFAQLVGQFPNWRLRYVGTGSLQEELAQEIQRLGIAGHVDLVSSVKHEDIPQQLHTADILVLPSCDVPTWKEQFGLVLAEAMASRVPVIGSSAGEIPHVIGKAGLVFEQNNKEQLVQTLKKLMESPELRQKYADLGYQRVQENFSREAIARQTVEFWRTLV